MIFNIFLPIVSQYLLYRVRSVYLLLSFPPFWFFYLLDARSTINMCRIETHVFTKEGPAKLRIERVDSKRGRLKKKKNLEKDRRV